MGHQGGGHRGREARAVERGAEPPVDPAVDQLVSGAVVTGQRESLARAIREHGRHGQAGVEHVLRCLLAELDLTVALSGYTEVSQIGPSALMPAPAPHRA